MDTFLTLQESILFLSNMCTVDDMHCFKYLKRVVSYCKGRLTLFRPDISLLGYDANGADPVQTPRSAASEPGLHRLLTGLCMQNTIKRKQPARTPKTRNEHIQIIRMDKSTGRKWVNI